MRLYANAVLWGKPVNNYQKDKKILRELAEKYSEIANLDIQGERIERYFKTISMEKIRPVVLIDEVPWGEIQDNELKNRCENRELGWLEERLRRSLYQWNHFQVDTVIPPEFRISKRIENSGIGIEVQETTVKGNTGTAIMSHKFLDQLNTEEDLEKLKLPVISYDKSGTEKAAEIADDIFSGLLPVILTGTQFSFSIWDRIGRCRGFDNLFADLATRPDFMHKTAQKFKEIGAATLKQLLSLDLLETDSLLVHCTPACARELPAEDFTGKVRPKDVWGRNASQIFAVVSPEMHDEFDLQYSQELFGSCGLLYYGCCEPMDKKIDILKKRFNNIRKISITPWADPENAARQINGDYVMAAKANPAFVNSHVFDPEPVRQEMRRYLDACKRYGTTCEFVLKDISTVANTPENLSRWADTVARTIDEYY